MTCGVTSEEAGHLPVSRSHVKAFEGVLMEENSGIFWHISNKCDRCDSLGHFNFSLTTSIVMGNKDSHKKKKLLSGRAAQASHSFPNKSDFYMNPFKRWSLSPGTATMALTANCNVGS